MNISTFSSVLNKLFIRFNDEQIINKEHAMWSSFARSGSELWLDTGDIEGAKNLWNTSFTALTTNNTLLNKEVQKGIYDKTIKEAGNYLQDMTPEDKVKEIALILNALHGQRLAKIFNAKVSVELHTDIAHDIEAIQFYGSKLHSINPEYFIIKVPFTAAGLIGARKLKKKGYQLT